MQSLHMVPYSSGMPFQNNLPSITQMTQRTLSWYQYDLKNSAPEVLNSDFAVSSPSVTTKLCAISIASPKYKLTDSKKSVPAQVNLH